MTLAPFTTQTATHKAKSGKNMYGEPSFGSATTLKCKFVDKLTKRTDANGDEIVADAVMYVARSTSIACEDFVTFGSNNYEVMTVETQTGTATTLNHKIVLLRKTAQS